MNTNLELLVEGVYFSTVPKADIKEFPLDEEYSCFMNHFYINQCTSELTEEQVFAICRKREQHIKIIGSINTNVKDIFRNFIKQGNFQDVIELGCGSNPTFINSKNSFNFTASDANEDVVYNTRKKGIKSIVFGSNDISEISSNYDLAFAVFVLHFHFSNNEIRSLGRHLKTKGIFIANIYRINEEKRSDLKNRFEDFGFFLERIKDETEICKNHEFWIIGKNKKTVRNESLRFKKIIKI